MLPAVRGVEVAVEVVVAEQLAAPAWMLGRATLAQTESSARTMALMEAQVEGQQLVEASAPQLLVALPCRWPFLLNSLALCSN